MQVLLISQAIAALCLLRVVYTVFKAATSPTRHIPGPFLARFTRAWYLRAMRKGDFERQSIVLHRQYARANDRADNPYFAPIVRVGPKLFSITRPEKQIYGVSSKMKKSEWYNGWKHPSPDRWTLFPDTDIARHNDTRKKFQAIYSLSSLVSYEGYVDDCIDIFEQRLKEMADGKHGTYVDMGHWLQCYAFDVIGMITYSKRFGFLDEGRDQNGMMIALENLMKYSSSAGIYHELHPWLYDLMQKLPASGARGRNILMSFATDRVNQRKQEHAQDEEKQQMRKDGDESPQDFLDKLLALKQDGKKGVNDYHVFIMGLSNIIAGSDTTGLSLSAIMYYLTKNQRCLSTLRDEIASTAGQIDEDMSKTSFKATQEMPYLQAVIKESLRLHPATGLPLWRVVGEGGAEICGEWLPAGSEVGINSWIAHYDRDIWGNDVEEFKPERWIDADAEKLKMMDQNYLPFGLGSRTCLGKHISYLEMLKLVPRIVRNFDFELEHPEREWRCENYWFVKPRDFRIKVKLRHTAT